MYKKILAILCSLLLILGMSGCQQKKEEEPQSGVNGVDLIALEEEYRSIMDLIDHVMFTITNDGVHNIQDAIELITYIQQNRVEPTQELTIALDNLLEQLISRGIDYYMASDANEQLQLEEEIMVILDQMEEIMIEIETLLDTYQQL